MVQTTNVIAGMQRNVGVKREKENCRIHERKNTIEICRFAGESEIRKREL
jgi:hypothetical protein